MTPRVPASLGLVAAAVLILTIVILPLAQLASDDPQSAGWPIASSILIAIGIAVVAGVPRLRGRSLRRRIESLRDERPKALIFPANTDDGRVVAISIDEKGIEAIDARTAKYVLWSEISSISERHRTGPSRREITVQTSQQPREWSFIPLNAGAARSMEDHEMNSLVRELIRLDARHAEDRR